MNWYELSRSIFDYAFEHKECGVYHISIYLWIVELNNRMGWKKEFWVPSHDTCDWLSIWNKNTYLSAIKDLEKWGFIRIVKESKNQFSATIVTICRIKSDTATTTALDTALIQQSTRHWYAIDTIDKQRNKETKKQENNTLVDKSTIQIWFDNFYSLYPKKINRKDAGLKYAIALKKWATIEIIEKGLKRSLYFWNSENTEKKFIPAPDVWLNKEKWNDEIKSEVPQDSEARLLEAKKRLEASPRTPISFN